MVIPFNDLGPTYTLLSEEINLAVQRVMSSGWYILGPELEAFEREFAGYHDIGHAVGVATGTDAIELALRAGGIGPGDEVITVSHTAVATVCAVEQAGAVPVLVDIDPVTYTMDPDAVRAAITPRTQAIVPVHIYGQTALMIELADIANRHGLLLIEDCAQAHGATHRNKLAGTFGHMGTFSFYPTKNLGAYGDGGAVITNDPHLAEQLRLLRNYGQQERYLNRTRGINSRLDELQAAILRVKLTQLDKHNAMRRDMAAIYSRNLPQSITPGTGPENQHVYHLYVIQHPERDRLMETLKQQGIGTLIHYPIPVHLQTPYADLGLPFGSLPVTERVVTEIVSLPLYIGLTHKEIEQVADAVNRMRERAVHA